jgi:plastocyanin
VSPPPPAGGFGGTSRRVALLVTLALAGACSTPANAPPPAAAPAPAATPSPTSGTLVGHGPRPAPGSQIVVLLEPNPPRSFPPQSEVPVMDQVGLTFGPDLLVVRTGQPVEFRNSDDTLHNVHVTHEETREPAFNVAIPTGNSYSYTFTRDGFYRIGCDIHPSMGASVFAASTPYATLADADGRFTIADVAPGAYVATLYGGGRKVQQPVDVKGGVVEVTIE